MFWGLKKRTLNFLEVKFRNIMHRLCKNLSLRVFRHTMSIKYSLVSKITGKNFAEYNGSALRVSTKTPMFYDEVVLQNPQNSKDIRKITTFRDKYGQISERAFDYFGNSYRNRLYERKDFVVNDEEWVEMTKVKDLLMSRAAKKEIYDDARELLEYFKITAAGWWQSNSVTHYLSKNLENGKKFLSSVFTQSGNKTDLHKFTEDTMPVNKAQKKKLEFKIDNKTYEVKKRSIKTQNVTAPKKDSFLGLRALEIQDAREPMARFFIRRRDLENTDLIINTNYLPLPNEKNIIAFYSDENGSINYNKLYDFGSKSSVANTASHETEHAWQWYLDARNTGGKTPYTTMIYKKFGDLPEGAIRHEADKYSDAIMNYVSVTEDFQKYHDSLLEEKARDMGKAVAHEYNFQGREIRNQFQHIPPEEL